MAFNVGYNKAISFLEGARNFYDKGDLAITAFMLQQATELTLRAIILAMTGNEVRTHSIVELFKNCRRIAPALVNEVSTDSELLGILDQAYLKTRYSESYAVEIEYIIRLFKKVECIQITSRKIFI